VTGRRCRLFLPLPRATCLLPRCLPAGRVRRGVSRCSLSGCHLYHTRTYLLPTTYHRAVLPPPRLPHATRTTTLLPRHTASPPPHLPTPRAPHTAPAFAGACTAPPRYHARTRAAPLLFPCAPHHPTNLPHCRLPATYHTCALPPPHYCNAHAYLYHACNTARLCRTAATCRAHRAPLPPFSHQLPAIPRWRSNPRLGLFHLAPVLARRP